MAGRRAGEVGNLAFHPHAAEHVFQQHTGAAIELADGKDLAVQAESFEGVSDHGGHHKGQGARLSVPALSSGISRSYNACTYPPYAILTTMHPERTTQDPARCSPNCRFPALTGCRSCSASVSPISSSALPVSAPRL
ncbi:hypothetical protein D3C76_1027510 [compost metagenome]